MTYITDTLAIDETLLAEGKISKWSLFHIYCAAAIFGATVVFLPVTAALLLYAWLKIKSTEMGITSKRVIRKSGVIMRDTAEIRLSKVESVSVRQGFLGRMFGYGDVVIAGTGGNGAVMKGVRNPLKFRAQVDEAADFSVNIRPKVEIGMAAFGVPPDLIAKAMDHGARELAKRGGAQ